MGSDKHFVAETNEREKKKVGIFQGS